jgi:hypothetical protein
MTKHITIGLFDGVQTLGQALTRNLQDLLEKYRLRKKIVAYVKDEGFNLERTIIIFKLIVNCEILEESFQRTCFGHAYFKAY